MDGVEDDGGEGLEFEAGVGVGGEEIAVVLKIVRADEADEVGEPEEQTERGRREREAKVAATAVTGACPEDVKDRRHEEDAGGLCEHDGGDENAESQRESRGLQRAG